VCAALIKGEGSEAAEGFAPEIFMKKLNGGYEIRLQTL